MSVDFGERLADSLSSKLPLASIGIDPDVVGAGQIAIPQDDDWKDALERLARSASLIFVIPAADGWVYWEIQQLVAWDLLHKTLFIMPPTSIHDTFTKNAEDPSGPPVPSQFETPSETPQGLNVPNSDFHEEDIVLTSRQIWTAAQQSLADLDLKLPDYREAGGLFQLKIGMQRTEWLADLHDISRPKLRDRVLQFASSRSKDSPLPEGDA